MLAFGTTVITEETCDIAFNARPYFERGWDFFCVIKINDFGLT